MFKISYSLSLIFFISYVYCTSISFKSQKVYTHPFARDVIREAEDISLVYRLSFMENPNPAYLPQLRQSFTRLKAKSAVKTEKSFLEAVARAFFNLEDFGSIKESFQIISLQDFKTSEALGRLRRFVEHLLKREDGPGILIDLWRTAPGSELYKLAGFVYALDWEGKVTAAYENINEQGFKLSFELISNKFNDEQRQHMHRKNVQIIEANFRNGRTKDELLLKNNIRYGTINLEVLETELNTKMFKKGVSLALFLERRVDLFNEILRPKKSPRSFPHLIELLSRKREYFQDVFLEHPDLLEEINVIHAQPSVQELYAFAIFSQSSQMDPSNSAFEQFLLSRKGKVVNASLHYLQMCSFYSRTKEEFAEVLGGMRKIPAGELFNFIFSKLSIGKESEFLRIACRKYEEDPDKFLFRDGNLISIVPFYKYFDDESVDRTVFRILDEFAEFKPLSVDDILYLINSPSKIIPSFLRSQFYHFDSHVASSVVVKVTSKAQAQRLVDLFGPENIYKFMESVGKSVKYLSPTSKHIIFSVLYECNPDFLN